MKASELVKYCNIIKKTDCFNCKHMEECDKFENKFHTIPYLERPSDYDEIEL